MQAESVAAKIRSKSKPIPLERIKSDDVKLRPVSEEKVAELMASFKVKGQQQAIRIRPLDEWWYVVVFGEHRLEAAKRLGWTVIDAIVEKIDEYEALELKVTENAHRNEYSDVWEQGRVFSKLMVERYDNSVDALAASLGKSPQFITDRTRVFHCLDPTLKQYLGNYLTAGNAIALARIQDKTTQVQLANRIIGSRQGNMVQYGGGGGYGTSKGGRVALMAECTCSKCGSRHKSAGIDMELDVKQLVGVTIGISSMGHGDVYHIENDKNPTYSFCGKALTRMWKASKVPQDPRLCRPCQVAFWEVNKP